MHKRQAERRKYHYIYKTTCKVNSKYYYGMHSTDDLNDGYIGSGTYLAKAIRRHRRENFELEILEHLPNREALKLREAELITEELLNDPMCMNLTLGGEGGWEIVNQKLTSEQRERCNAAGRAAFKAKLESDISFRQKFAASSGNEMKKKHAAGKIKYDTFSGRRHSEEALKKMRSHIGRNVGEKNSQFGKRWMSRDGEIIRVTEQEVEQLEQIGWKRGKKF